MPYKKKERLPFESVTELIRGKGYTSPKLAKVLGCSPNTAMKKLRNPHLITLEDIGKLHRGAHISMDELRGAIKE